MLLANNKKVREITLINISHRHLYLWYGKQLSPKILKTRVTKMLPRISKREFICGFSDKTELNTLLMTAEASQIYTLFVQSTYLHICFEPELSLFHLWEFLRGTKQHLPEQCL